MKRSRINDILGSADDMIRSHGFALPPFAYWTPDEFKAKAETAMQEKTKELTAGLPLPPGMKLPF